MKKTLSPFLFVICFAVSAAQAAVSDADVQFLTEGVAGIGEAGIPGPLCVFGKDAAAVIAGKGEKGNALSSLLAAATSGKGRVLAFGHGGYLSETQYANEGTKRLAANMFGWLAQNNKSARIAVVRKPGFADFITTLGYRVEKLNALPDANALEKFQVLVLDSGDLPADRIEHVSQFVSNGGGLLTASLGWGWLIRNTDLRSEHIGNRLLAPMGIVWTDGYLSNTTEKDGTKLLTVTPKEPLTLLNVTEAMTALEGNEKGTAKLTPAQLAQATATIKRNILSIPPSQAYVVAPLKKYLDQEGQAAGNDFPGAVPADARIMPKTVEVDTKIPDWHSTGLYAAPGSTVTVTIPKELAVPDGTAIGVRIGCHKDSLRDKSEWKRFPEITLEIPCRNEKTEIANPFGGPVYIVVPKNYNKGTISVNIDGCIEAPLYVHGKTSLRTWRRTRNAPAPWGELVSDRVILTLPSEHLRTLDDPDNVMEFWNKVLDVQADLCGQPIQRERPERLVCDRQISAGYMHAGYPVMTQMDVEKQFLDLRFDPGGKGWGFFHEFGHNHQASDWTFSGASEVTVNLFTLYTMEHFGLDPRTTHSRVKLERRTKDRTDYFAAGSQFDKWKADAFLALIMYTDLIDEFGWEPFKVVFREYRQLKNEERPKNDDEKRDQWMVRMSRQIGKNLGPYFDRWGVPVSQSAKDSIKELPVWMPYVEIQDQ